MGRCVRKCEAREGVWAIKPKPSRRGSISGAPSKTARGDGGEMWCGGVYEVVVMVVGLCAHKTRAREGIWAKTRNQAVEARFGRADTHAFTLRAESCSNRPFRRLYTDPTPRRPSAISMMSMLSDVSPINTRVSCPIARGWSLVPHQFRGLVSHISPLKHYSKLVSTVRNNRHIDIDTIATE